ncbi:MAG: hypothetical protein R2880_07135 [Deinococcales bacterium]
MAVRELHQAYGDVFSFGMGAFKFISGLVEAQRQGVLFGKRADLSEAWDMIFKADWWRTCIIHSEAEHLHYRRLVQGYFQARGLEPHLSTSHST